VTGAEFKQARLRAGLSYRRAAALLGVSLRTIQLWEERATVPDRATAIEHIGEESDIPYVMGRIAALVERAIGYQLPRTAWLYASVNPQVGLGTLMRLYHRPGVDRSGTEDRVMDLMQLLPAELPAVRAGDGRFALGYYQEKGRQAPADPC
jgi:DNA-binding XRE family transcriptional regulator